MHRRGLPFVALAVLAACLPAARGDTIGASIPWTTYEAEAMRTTGRVLGPRYDPYTVEAASSGERCVRLDAGQYVEFTAAAAANALVVRYCLPDAPAGGGTTATLTVAVGGRVVRTVPVTSHYAWLYGAYPFTNAPRAGKPRAFYDEVRVPGLAIVPGEVIRVGKAAAGAGECFVDLVDLEQVAPPRRAPAGALSVRDHGAVGDGVADDTAALRACVAEASRTGRPVWVPPGDYRLTGDIVVPSSVTLQGAGMWHTRFVGDAPLYGQADRRVRFRLTGRGIGLADFAIVGRLDYRDDQEPNDGILGAGCTDSSIERIWIEHTKVGIWIYNGRNLRIEGCRFRDTLADGVNLCVGTADCVIEDCTARGTGDDCFAIWPAPADQGFAEAWRPGHNVIRHCTGALPFLANGAAIYGGAGNRIEDCRFTDITVGCGILLSTTFPTADPARGIDNNFSGTTVVRGCELVRCGGFDHDWGWRGAFQVCMDRCSISGVAVSGVAIRDSLSDGVAIAGPGSAQGHGTLADARFEQVTVGRVGLGRAGSHAWVIRPDAEGAATIDVPSAVQNDSAHFMVRAAPAGSGDATRAR